MTIGSPAPKTMIIHRTANKCDIKNFFREQKKDIKCRGAQVSCQPPLRLGRDTVTPSTGSIISECVSMHAKHV